MTLTGPVSSISVSLYFSLSLSPVTCKHKRERTYVFEKKNTGPVRVMTLTGPVSSLSLSLYFSLSLSPVTCKHKRERTYVFVCAGVRQTFVGLLLPSVGCSCPLVGCPCHYISEIKFSRLQTTLVSTRYKAPSVACWPIG